MDTTEKVYEVTIEDYTTKNIRELIKACINPTTKAPRLTAVLYSEKYLIKKELVSETSFNIFYQNGPVKFFRDWNKKSSKIDDFV